MKKPVPEYGLWVLNYDLFNGLRFAGATQNVLDLVFYDFLYAFSGGSQVLYGIEVRGILVVVLSDSCGNRHFQVGVDIDLSDSHLCGLS